MTETPTITTIAAARPPVAAIRRTGLYRALVTPDADWRAELATDLDLLGLRKLRMSVEISVEDGGLLLTGHLGATVSQPCVITLDPVTTRIEAPVQRRYVEDLAEPEEEETEIPEDDSLEPLGAVIDLAGLLHEVLVLNLPTYPRSDAAAQAPETYNAQGAEADDDAVIKPFAGLQSLRDKLEDDQG